MEMPIYYSSAPRCSTRKNTLNLNCNKIKRSDVGNDSVVQLFNVNCLFGFQNEI